MKGVGFISLSLSLFLTFSYAGVEIKSYTGIEIKNDTAIKSSKDEIASTLIHLRDSIDNSMLDLQKRLVHHRQNLNQSYLDKVYNELTDQRREIEAFIEDVVTSSESDWTTAARMQAMNQISQRRRAYYEALRNYK